ncbi:MAG: hypothetical protein KDB14_33230 [Planctomycetales bacterium]|nr:hypothetical protein [Planctomycetales bacterium]
MAIPAQRGGIDLKVVAVGGAGLPAWPIENNNGMFAGPSFLTLGEERCSGLLHLGFSANLEVAVRPVCREGEAHRLARERRAFSDHLGECQ